MNLDNILGQNIQLSEVISFAVRNQVWNETEVFATSSNGGKWETLALHFFLSSGWDKRLKWISF